ncbi:24006_t:CDS:2, partial [Cetraspora pellucida]
YISISDIKITQSDLDILQHALSQDYKYIIDSFNVIQAYNVLGACAKPFEADFHVNISTIDDAKTWLEKFSDLHKGHIIKGVRYLFSKRLHCIHGHAVKLKQGQEKNNVDNEISENTEIEEKKKAKVSAHTRDTNCLAKLSIKVQNKYCTYPCIISLLFHHNHPLAPGHTTSFRPISNNIKETFFSLFNSEHTPISAYNTYIEEIQLKHDNDEVVLADRAICPYKHNIYNLHRKFLNESIGAWNKKEMFSRLAEEVSDFNTHMKENAWMQPYIASVNGDPGQPFILVVITNLMKCCHSLQQAKELVYIDATVGLDTLNTPLTIISTSTPIGGLPLAAILTSDETTITFTKALDMLKHIMPSTVFGGCGPLVGPQVIMTNDSTAERKALQCTWEKATLL